MSRKKVAEDRALAFGIRTRINAEHFARLQRQLEQSHYRTMAEMIRDMVCSGKVKVVTVDNTLAEVMERLVPVKRELNAIGTNLNQIARALNSQKGRQVLHVVELIGLIREVEGKIAPINLTVAQLAQRWLSSHVEGEQPGI